MGMDVSALPNDTRFCIPTTNARYSPRALTPWSGYIMVFALCISRVGFGNRIQIDRGNNPNVIINVIRFAGVS